MGFWMRRSWKLARRWEEEPEENEEEGGEQGVEGE